MKVINTWQDEEALRRYTLIAPLLFILAEMYRRSGGTDTAVPVEVYRQTGTGYRLHHSG